MFPQFWQTAYALVLLPFLINNGIQITAPKVQIASRIQTNDIKHPRFFRSATAWTFTLSLPHFGQIIIISSSRKVSYTWQKKSIFQSAIHGKEDEPWILKTSGNYARCVERRRSIPYYLRGSGVCWIWSMRMNASWQQWRGWGRKPNCMSKRL